MSLLGSIVSKILHPFGGGDAQAKPSEANAQPSAGGSDAPAATPTSTGAPAGGPVDVEQVLNGMAAKNAQTLNWRTSIVDLMKLLDLDSSLAARKELGQELGVHAGDDGSAEQNIALHKAVMAKLAENGGIVPDSLRN